MVGKLKEDLMATINRKTLKKKNHNSNKFF